MNETWIIMEDHALFAVIEIGSTAHPSKLLAKALSATQI